MKAFEIDFLKPAEKRKLINSYRALLRAMPDYTTREQKREIRRAFNIAISAHSNVRRKSGEPYIFHPLSVALICARDMTLGATSVICALLHDVVEDSEYTLEDIESVFGSKIARVIDGLTKISGVVGKTHSIQAENFRKILLTMSRDVRVILVKLADRLHNMRTLDAMPAHKRLQIASETMTLFAPLAHRLGLYSIKTEMEDLVLKYTEPEIYEDIQNKLKNTKNQRYNYIRKFMAPIRRALDKKGFHYEIKWRTKSVYSIYRKMQRQDIPFEQVFDLFAIRIILDAEAEQEKSDCWKAYSLVSDHYAPNTSRLRDWISVPKANGYESLHGTFMGPGGRWVEVQIRSRRMHEVAEKGFAAHWRYKGGSASDAAIEEWLNRVRTLLEDPAVDAVEFLDDFRMHLYDKEVYVFTPKGELRVLPAQSTALDFAFDIHTKVGYHCLSAKVNHKLVPLSHRLANGDQVEIVTSKKQKPTEDWLRFVATSKARTQIKRALKEQARAISKTGKEVLLRKARHHRIKLTEAHLYTLCRFFKVDNDHDLYYKIGLGMLSGRALQEGFETLRQSDTSRHQPRKPEKPEPVEASGARSAKAGSETLVIGGHNDLEYQMASCCNPIPGDEIFGYVTIGKGITIHRANCPNGLYLLSRYKDRILKARWDRDLFEEPEYDSEEAPQAPEAVQPREETNEPAFVAADEEGLSMAPSRTFAVGVRITGIDQLGILAKISDLVGEVFRTQMDKMVIEARHGAFEGHMLLQVADRSHLKQLIDRLNQLDGIDRAIRMDPGLIPSSNLPFSGDEKGITISANPSNGAQQPTMPVLSYSKT